MEIPLLQANDIECRVQSVKKSKSGNVGAVLLLYKDARVDMRILDQVFGPLNWQRTHDVINGNLFCAIDIWDESKRAWVRKQDVGVESNTQKEKGEASDSFKRAGTNVGIGRELYTAPFIYITLQNGEYNENGNKLSCTGRFTVAEVGYNERREMNRLVIVDKRGNPRFDWRYGPAGDRTAEETQKQNTTQPGSPAKPEKLICAACGKEITGVEVDGKAYSAEQIAKGAVKRYGKPLCITCRNAAAEVKVAQLKQATVDKLKDGNESA